MSIMDIAAGIALAFIAMLSWGIGDFFIQKNTRKFGDWETLFVVTAFGAILLLPFAYRKLPLLLSDWQSLSILMIASIVLLFAALADFEALRRGKLAVVEPIWSFEIPVAAFLAFLFLNEKITFLQLVLVVMLLFSLFLVAFKGGKISKKMLLEKGVALAIVAAILMGGANFFMGWGGRVTDFIMVNFFTDAFLMIVTGIYLLIGGKLGKVFHDLKYGYRDLLPMSIADKIAWLTYVLSMTLAPIAIATALSESYIIVAVLLGLAVNKEKLRKHQKVGILLAIVVAVTLAVVTTS